MSNIEERIVQLTLNSKDFEKNTKTSIAALEKLDEALKLTGSKQSIQDLQSSVNSVDFSKLADNVEKINKRFSVFGIASATVISNLTNRATDFGIKMLNSINPVTKAVGLMNAGINQIKTGGWSRATKIDQAKFKIEGLGQEWDKVSKRINYGVDDTAYGFDQAANAAAQLVASGVKMSDIWSTDNVDELGVALRAISGVAAMTGANYDLLADVFIDAAAAGKVTADTFNRISAQGLNAKAELGKFLNKTQEEIDEMSRKGQISFAQFAEAMDSAFGEQAAKSNKTFEGALANMKAALNRIGAEFVFPIREAGIQIFNAARLRIKAFKELIGSVSDDVEDQFVDKFATVIDKGSDIIARVIDSIPVESFQKIVDYSSKALDAINGLLDGINALMDSIPWLAKKEEEAATDTAESVTSVVDAEARVIELANEVLTGKYGNGQERKDALGKSFKVVQNMVNEMLDHPFRYDLAEDETAEAIFGVAEATDEAAKATDNLREAQEELHDGQKVLMNTPLGAIYVEKEVSNAEKAKTAFEGLASALDVLKNTGKAIGAGAKDNIINLGKSIGQGFLDAGYAIGNWTIKFRTWLEETGAYEKITNKVNEVTGWLVEKLKSIGGFGKKSFGVIQNAAGKVWTVLGQAKGNVDEFFTAFKDTSGYKRLETVFTSVRDRVIEIKNSAVQALTDAINSFMGTEFTLPEFDAGKFASSVSDKIDWLLDKITLVKTSILNLFSSEDSGDQAISDGISPKLQNALTLFNTFKDSVLSIGQSIIDAISNVFSSIFGLFTGKGSEESASTEPIMSRMVSDFVGTEVETVATTVNNAQGIIDTVTQTVQGFADNISNAVAPLADSVPITMNDVIDAVHSVLDVVKDFAKEIAIIGGYRTIWNLSGVVGGISRILNNGGKILGSANKFVKNAAEIPKKITGLIGSFSKSIKTFVDGLNKNLTRITKAESRLRNAKAILLMAAAIGILAGAVYVIGSMKAGDITKALIVIAALGAVLAALFAIIGYFFGNNKKAEEIKNAPSTLSETLNACKSIFKSFLKNIGRAAVISSIGLTIAALGGVMLMLGLMDWKTALRGVGFMTLIFIGLLGAMHVLNKIGSSEKSGLRPSMALIMLFMAFAVGILASTVKKLGKMDTGSLIKGGLAVSVLMLVLSKAIKDMNSITSDPANAGKKGGIGTALTIFAVAAAVAALGKQVAKLGAMDTAQLLKGGVAIVAIVMLVKSILKTLGGMKDIKISGLFTLSILISVLVGSMILLGSMKASVLIRGGLALGSIIAMLTLFTHFSGKMKKNSYMPLLSIVAVIGAIALAFKTMALIDPKSLSASTKSIRKILRSLSLLSFTSGRFNKGTKWKSIAAGYLGMSFVLTTIALVFQVLSSMDPNKMLTISESISKVVVALSAVTASISLLGGNRFGGGFRSSFSTGLGSILAFDILLADIVAIELLAAKVNDAFPALSEFLDSGAPLLEKIGHSIGSLIGGFLSGALFEPIKNNFSGFDEGFTNFSTAILNLITAVGGEGGIDSAISSLESLEGLITVLGRIGLESLFTNVVNSITDPQGTADFINGLASLAQPLYNLAYAFDNITTVNGEVISVDSKDLQKKMETIKAIVSALNGVTWGSAFTNLGISFANNGIAGLIGLSSGPTNFLGQLQKNSAIKNIKEFVTELSELAPDLYDLAYAFSVIESKTDKYGNTYEISSEDIEPKVKAVGAIISAISLVSWKSAFANLGITTADDGISGLLGFTSLNTSFLGSVNKLSEGGAVGKIKTFVERLTKLADPLYELAFAFSKLKTKKATNGRAYKITPEDIEPKVKAVGAIISAISLVSWKSAFANLGITAADDGISGLLGFTTLNTPVLSAVNKLSEEGAVGKIKNFVERLTKLADPLYDLAFAFSKIKTKTDPNGKAYKITPEDIEPKIKAVGAVISAISLVSWKSAFANLGISAADNGFSSLLGISSNSGLFLSSWDKLSEGGAIGKIKTFVERLEKLADPLYDLAFAFSQIKSKTDENGKAYKIKADDIEPKVKAVGTIISSIGEATWISAFASWGIDAGSEGLLGLKATGGGLIGLLAKATSLPFGDKASGQSLAKAPSSVEKIKEFIIQLSDLAQPLYELAEAFSSITIEEGKVIDTENLGRRVSAIRSMVTAIGDASWATVLSNWGISTANGGVFGGLFSFFGGSSNTSTGVPLLNSVQRVLGVDAVGSMITFIHSLQRLAEPLYELAAAFDGLGAEVGEDTPVIDAKGLEDKVLAIKSMVTAIGDASWATVLSNWGVSVSNGGVLGGLFSFFSGGNSISQLSDLLGTVNEDGIGKVIKFANRLQKLAPSLGQLAIEFSSIQIDEGITLDAEDIQSKVLAVRAMVEALGDTAWLSALGRWKIDTANNGLIGGVFSALGFGTKSWLLEEYEEIAGKDAIGRITAFAGQVQQLATPLTNLINAFGPIIDVSGSAGNVALDTDDPFANVKSVLTNLMDLSDLIDELYEGGYLEKSVQGLFDRLAVVIEEDGTFSESLGAIGKAIVRSMVNGIVADKEDAKAIIDALLGVNATDESSDSGKDSGNAFGSSMEEIIAQYGPSIQALITEDGGILDQTSGGITDSSDKFTTAMDEIMSALQKTMQGTSWRFKIAISNVLNAAINTMRNFHGSFNSAGGYLMDGLASGIKSKQDVVISAIQAVTDASENELRDNFAVASPSKMTMEIGQYLMTGLAMGIINHLKEPTDAASKSAISLVRTMSDSVNSEAESKSQELYNSLLGMYAYVNYAINEALDTQPTITPVMDLSMIQNGANSINGMLSGYSLGTGSLSYARSMFPGTSSVYNSQANHQAISAATVQGIREDIRSLGSAISNMQMVLDSGTLVGSIGGGMDRELGSIQKLRERWA